MPEPSPTSTVNLGLDLEGGSYLLLEVDMPGVVKERLETLRAEIREQFRRDRIGYAGLNITNDSVHLHLLDSAQAETAHMLLHDLASPQDRSLVLGAAEYDVTDDGEGNFTLKMSGAYQRQIRTQIVNQSIEVVRRRINELFTRQPTIQQQGEDRIRVQVPGVTKREELKYLFAPARMSFRLIDMTGSVQDALAGRVPADDELLWETDKAGMNTVPYLVQRRVIVSGDQIERATAAFDKSGRMPVVDFQFNTRGTRELADVTKENVNKKFAIVLDNKVISAPVIREPILSGLGQISGDLTVETAGNLAILLNSGALPSALTVIEDGMLGAEPVVGPVKADRPAM